MSAKFLKNLCKDSRVYHTENMDTCDKLLQVLKYIIACITVILAVVGIIFWNELSCMISKISKTTTMSDILGFITLMFAVIGGIFAYSQWRENSLLKKAEYVYELTMMMRTDEYIRETIYLFLSDKRWYNNSFHCDSKLEPMVDRTLTFYSYVCYLTKNRVLSESEFSFFEFYIVNALKKPQVQDYLYNLYHFSSTGNAIKVFNDLFEYGKEKKLFDYDFFDEESHENPYSKYHKYIEKGLLLDNVFHEATIRIPRPYN